MDDRASILVMLLFLGGWNVIALALVFIASASFGEEKALWAYGNWHLAGGESAKSWIANFQIADDGTFGSSVTIGQPYDPCVMTGSVDDDRLSINLRGEREGVVAEWKLEATIYGTRLVGQLEGPDGTPGEWDGWWQPVFYETPQPRLLASDVKGRRGGSAWFAVTLDSGRKSIAGVQNDISIDEQVQIVDCAADDMLPKELFFSNRDGRVRAIVLAVTNSDAIRPAVLYRCQVTISAEAALGIHPVRMFAAAGSDPDGNPKDIQPVDGAIEVVAADAVGFDAVPRLAWEADESPPGGGSLGDSSAAGDGGCAIGSSGRSRRSWLPLLLFAALCVARAGRPSRPPNKRGAADAGLRPARLTARVRPRDEDPVLCSHDLQRPS